VKFTCSVFYQESAECRLQPLAKNFKELELLDFVAALVSVPHNKQEMFTLSVSRSPHLVGLPISPKFTRIKRKRYFFNFVLYAIRFLAKNHETA
jgi:hypothetical protein